MRVRDRGSILEVDDVPGLHWVLGLLFVGVGTLFLVGPLGLFTDAERLRWWLRVLIAGMGAITAVVGVWQIARAPRSRLTIDRTNAQLRLERTGLGGRKKYEWPLSESRPSI